MQAARQTQLPKQYRQFKHSSIRAAGGKGEAMIKLKTNERLIHAGSVSLCAPNGQPLPAVPQYMIVPVEEANPADITDIKGNEQIILAGKIFNDKKTAEERFAAKKTGQKQVPMERGTPLYILEDKSNVNPKTGLTHEEEKFNRALAKDLCEVFAIQMRKNKALERQIAGQAKQ